MYRAEASFFHRQLEIPDNENVTARKPPTLKLLSGTARPDRDGTRTPALPPVDDLPAPPGWLTSLEGVKEFRRLAAILANNRLLTGGNLELLSHYAALHGRLIELWASGKTPTAALLNVLRGYAGSLGLTSMKLPAAVPRPANRFSRHADRRKPTR